MFIDKVGFLLDLVPSPGRRLARLSTQFVESGEYQWCSLREIHVIVCLSA